MKVTLRELSVAGAAGALFVVMALAFLGPVAWPDSPTTIPVYDPNATAGNGIANTLFEGFGVAVILIAILLGAAMIGGVYLAKMDEPGKVGP
ncbi:MAG TPA: NADH-quinone oxidoreductase subunit J [Thermoplasmata archaeon]|jgi:NADH:ubiquinone oxidoreductase subunit 6 (subunit J)|nr:NADH-quinone oxidoreductase subunit J [Thermoplasmata archaeon]